MNATLFFFPPEVEGSTPSPTTNQFVPNEEELFQEVLLWVSLSFALIFVYVILRSFFPNKVILRSLPFPGEESSSNRFFAVFRQLKRTLSMPEKDIIGQCGMDGYMTIRLIRFCLDVLCVVCLFNLVVLVPIYHAQEQTEECVAYCAEDRHDEDAKIVTCVCEFVDKCSLANVPLGSSTLWLSAFAMGLLSILVLARLKIEYKETVRIRLGFWATKPSRLHTVFVDRIPQVLAPLPILKQYFETLFPGQVYSIELVSNVEKLKEIGKRRMKVLNQLERAIALKAATGRSPVHLDMFCHTNDSIEKYASELESLNSQFKLVKSSQEVSLKPRQAFVTFRTVSPSVIASQTMLHPNMLIRLAPDPNDVRWDTLGERKTGFTRFVRKLFSRFLFAVVLLFWGAFTSLIGALTSTDALAHQFSGLNDFLLDHPGFISWLDRASTLIYVIVIALVYPIIAFSVKLEVRIAESNVERAILERYFLFLVVQVFVFYSIAGSVFKSSVEIVDHPASIFTTLASTIPKNASFFISFITVKTFWLFFDWVRGYNFIFSLLRRLFFGKTLTNREFRTRKLAFWDFYFPAPLGLSSAGANVLLIFFIAVSYACIQPLVTFAALVYFGSVYVVFFVMLTTSSLSLFDGGGMFWTHAFWCVTASIVTSQLTLVGTLLTKQAFPQATFVFLVCVATLVLSSHLSDQYREPCTEVTLEVASDLDRSTREGEPKVVRAPISYQYSTVVFEKPMEHDGNSVFHYVDPVLLEPEFLAPHLSGERFHELGENARGPTGGDLGYARMLDLDGEASSFSTTTYGALESINS